MVDSLTKRQLPAVELDALVRRALGVPLLTYERGLMRTEAPAFELMTSHGLPVPEILLHEDGLLLMTALKGEPWSAARSRLSDAEHGGLRRQLGVIVRDLHRITGDLFGYAQGPNAPTWREAFTRMVDAVLADADRFGVELPDVRPAVAARAHLLDELELQNPAGTAEPRGHENVVARERGEHGRPGRPPTAPTFLSVRRTSA